MITAIITARGGSKRLPRKNVLPFCGKPLVAWSIIQSRCSRLVDLTVLTTDDDEIAAIGKKYKADEIIMRSGWDPDTNANVSWTYALLDLKGKGYQIDTFLGALPTNPLRKPDDFDNSIRLYKKLGVDSLGTRAPVNEIIAYKEIGENRCIPSFRSYRWECITNGACWIVYKAAKWIREIADYPGSDTESVKKIQKDIRTIPDSEKEVMWFYPVEAWQRFDIDYELDFAISEMLFKKYVLKNSKNPYEDYAKEKHDD